MKSNSRRLIWKAIHRRHAGDICVDMTAPSPSEMQYYHVLKPICCLSLVSVILNEACHVIIRKIRFLFLGFFVIADKNVEACLTTMTDAWPFGCYRFSVEVDIKKKWNFGCVSQQKATRQKKYVLNVTTSHYSRSEVGLRTLTLKSVLILWWQLFESQPQRGKKKLYCVFLLCFHF